MTPSNPNNSQPLIYRIADALGIPHLVVAVQHSHIMSEIEGLVSALAGKSDTDHTHKLIQYNPSASTDGFAGFTVSGAGSFTIEVSTDKRIEFQFGPTVKASITNSNVDNLARALLTPDSTPNTNSDNLVTSGGVKAALDEKAPVSHSHSSIAGDGYIVSMSEDGVCISVNNGEGEVYINENNIGNLDRALRTPDAQPIADSDNFVTSGAVAAALRNATKMRQSINIPEFNVASELEKGIVYDYIFTNNGGEDISLISCFDISSLPESERNLYVTENGDGVTIHDGDVFGVRICRLDEGVFVEYLGLFV